MYYPLHQKNQETQDIQSYNVSEDLCVTLNPQTHIS